MSFGIVQQHDLPVYVAASACMAAGCELDDFIAEFGEREGGYSLLEAVCFLQKRGIFVGLNPSVPVPRFTPAVGCPTDELLTDSAGVMLSEIMEFFGMKNRAQALETVLDLFGLQFGLHLKTKPTGSQGSDETSTSDTGAYLPAQIRHHGWTVKVASDLPALVSCRYKDKGKSKGSGHMVFWNGLRILDPNRDKPQNLTDYIVEAWFPLYQMLSKIN